MKEAIEIAVILQEVFGMNTPIEIALAVSVPVLAWKLPEIIAAIGALVVTR